MQILWFIPTGSHDGRYLGTDIGSRVATPDYLQQIAQAVDTLGYTGALLPTGSSCEDAWITAATFISVTKRMKFLVAIRPGITSPGAAARMTATFDRISKGRLLINVVTGEDPVQLAGDVIVRETESAAWDAANELIKYVDEDAIAKAQENLASSDSEGQRRMSQLHSGSRETLEISPDLWTGIGLVRGGAGTALVGDPDTVAARMLEYQELGIETFVFSGYPHLEEAYRTAELLFPRLPLQSEPTPLSPAAVSTVSEIVANEKSAKQLTSAS